jgi:hypothetical protein
MKKKDEWEKVTMSQAIELKFIDRLKFLFNIKKGGKITLIISYWVKKSQDVHINSTVVTLGEPVQPFEPKSHTEELKQCQKYFEDMK